MFEEHNKSFSISYARPHCIMRSFMLWQWKQLSFGINFCSYLIGSFHNFWNKF